MNEKSALSLYSKHGALLFLIQKTNFWQSYARRRRNSDCGCLQLGLHALPRERAEARGRGRGAAAVVGVNLQLEPFQRHGAAVHRDAVEVGHVVAVGLVGVGIVAASTISVNNKWVFFTLLLFYGFDAA